MELQRKINELNEEINYLQAQNYDMETSFKNLKTQKSKK